MGPLDGVIWTFHSLPLMTGPDLEACTLFMCPGPGSSLVRVGESLSFLATLNTTSLCDPGDMVTHIQATQGLGTESGF